MTSTQHPTKPEEPLAAPGFVDRVNNDDLPQSLTGSHPSQQQARLTLRMGRNVGLDMRLRLTAQGILAVGGLVSSILLSTAVLVAVAVREGKR